MQNMRLEHKDEFPHAVGPEENFNESMYFNVFDPLYKVGGFFRIGNRPNEGYAEMTVCLYLPDGTVAFMYKRPKITKEYDFNAGGLSFRVDEPFKRFTLNYSGQVLTLQQPEELSDPGLAFKNNPQQPCEIQLDYTGLSPLHGGEPTEPGAQTMYGRNFSLGHFNQHVAATGTMRIGEQTWQINGLGWRDHSWGPRYWQNIGWYRLLLANFGDDAGFMLLKITDPNRVTRRVGVFMRDGDYEELEDVDLFTEWTPDGFHRIVRLHARTAKGMYAVEGHVRTMVPLRNRRDIDGKPMETRIGEGMTEWNWNGRTGWGLCEYLDQIVDGRPIGVPN